MSTNADNINHEIADAEEETLARSSSSSQYDNTILSSVPSSPRPFCDDSNIGRWNYADKHASIDHIPEPFLSSESVNSTPSSLSLSLNPSMVGSSILFASEMTGEYHSSEQNDSKRLQNNKTNSSMVDSSTTQIAPPEPSPCILDSESSISFASRVSHLRSDSLSSLPADSFANIGRSLMLSFPSSDTGSCNTEDCNISTASLQLMPLPSKRGEKGDADIPWWTRFQTDDDWDSFRTYAKDYLHTFISQEMKESDEMVVVERPKVTKTWLQGLYEVLTGYISYEDRSRVTHAPEASAKLLLSLIKQISAIQQQLDELPSIPPPFPEETSLMNILNECTDSETNLYTHATSDGNNTQTSSSSRPLSSTSAISHLNNSCIPSQFVCPICQDIVVGATLIDCEYCSGSISNRGAVSFCRSCLEETTCMQCDNCDKNATVCPFCSTMNKSCISPSPRSIMCRPVPCHALDVAIVNFMVKLVVSPADRKRNNDACMIASQQHLLSRYRARLAEWRVCMIRRRKALQAEHDQCQEEILTAIIAAEETLFWRDKVVDGLLEEEKMDKLSNDRIDEEDASLLGAVNDDGYVEVIGKESFRWDDASDALMTSQSNCSLTFRAACVAAATTFAGIVVAMHSRRV